MNFAANKGCSPTSSNHVTYCLLFVLAVANSSTAHVLYESTHCRWHYCSLLEVDASRVKVIDEIMAESEHTVLSDIANKLDGVHRKRYTEKIRLVGGTIDPYLMPRSMFVEFDTATNVPDLQYPD